MQFWFILLASVIYYVSPLYLSSIKIIVPAGLIALPISLHHLLTKNEIRSVDLTMGHLTYKMPGTPFSDSIIARIQAQRLLSTNIMTQMADSFGFSGKEAFRIWDAASNTLIIADPNDKLCTQQIQALFRIFFPCKNFLQARLTHLKFIDQLTSGYLGIKLVWNNTQTTLQIVSQTDNSYQNVAYIRNTICGMVQVKPFSESGLKYLGNSYRRYYKVISLSQWYNPQKTIAFLINKPLDPVQSLKISFLLRLPPGFIPKSLILKSAPSSYAYNTYNIVKSDDYSHLIRIDVELSLLDHELELHLSFRAGIPLFEKFEVISGGGQQIMVVSIIDMLETSSELYSHRVSQQLLQPDFSINFKVITSYAAVVLLIWLTLWRQHQLHPPKSTLECQ